MPVVRIKGFQTVPQGGFHLSPERSESQLAYLYVCVWVSLYTDRPVVKGVKIAYFS